MRIVKGRSSIDGVKGLDDMQRMQKSSFSWGKTKDGKGKKPEIRWKGNKWKSNYAMVGDVITGARALVSECNETSRAQKERFGKWVKGVRGKSERGDGSQTYFESGRMWNVESLSEHEKLVQFEFG